MVETEQNKLPPEQLPFSAKVNSINTAAPFGWISLGWKDFTSAPKVSVIYGLVLAGISYLLAFASWKLGGAVLLFSLLSGLVFLAPVLALGLYSVSCQIEAGFNPKLAYCLREGKRHLGNELIFSVVMLVIFLLWVRAGSAIHIFFPMESEPPIQDLMLFYAIGSVIGAVFASIAFCVSAFALPMMLDRKADAITAVITSVNAVLKNKPAMVVWAMLIVISILLCLVSGFILMPLVMPVIGYATWHGYKQTIDASLWPENRKLNERFPVSES